MIGNCWQRLAATAACASLVSFAACKGRNGNGSDTANTTAASGEVARPDSAATAAAPGATTPSTTPAAGTAGSASGSSTMSITGGDSEILQVLAVVDQGEIQDGQLAQRQARSAQVKSFARELVADHSKSLQQDRSLAKTANVDLSSVMASGSSGSKRTGTDTSKSASPTSATSATPSGVVGQLMTAHTQMMDQVRAQKGAAFDSAFVNAEVTGHQQVLDLLQRSQSQAQNPGVQKHVAAAIKDVQSHLERGQKLQQSLASGGSAGASDSTSKSKTRSDTGKRG